MEDPKAYVLDRTTDREEMEELFREKINYDAQVEAMEERELKDNEN